MAFEVVVPKWGLTMEEALINQWLKQEGEKVEKDEPLLEIETEKVANVVEAPASGILARVICHAGENVKVGQVLALIAEPGEAVPDVVEYKKAQTVEPAVAVATDRIKASPVVKKMAAGLGVDLTRVQGTGVDGRIISDDVKKYAASASATSPETTQPKPGTVVALTKMRRAVGINLQRSSQDTPHFNVTMSIYMSRAMKVRKQLNESRSKEQRVSVNDLVVRACALALKQYPAVNSRLEGDNLNYLVDVNIGIATSVQDGLVVPVLTNADKRNWYDLATEAKRLAQQARSGKVIGAGKGTFTVSNLGMFDVDNFTAIVNPPESAILVVGVVKNKVVDIGGEIGLQPIMKVTLCSDHRVVDGVLAAQFLKFIKTYMEEQISAQD